MNKTLAWVAIVIVFLLINIVDYSLQLITGIPMFVWAIPGGFLFGDFAFTLLDRYDD